AGCAPKAIPAGKKTGNEVNRVPSDVPVAAAMIQTRINVTGTKKAAPTPSSFASQMKPDDSSVTSNSCDIRLTTSKIMIKLTAAVDMMPPSADSQYCANRRENRDVIISPTNPLRLARWYRKPQGKRDYKLPIR